MFVRTFGGGKMNAARLWLAAATLQALLLTASCGKPHRRSMPNQQSQQLSKSGWRPVIGSNGYVFGYGTAPLHAPSYKIQVPVQEAYPSSARPLPARDATKLTSIAQSYRPTTHRTVPAHPNPAASQPINSYLNPFSLPNTGFNYKYVQNFPMDSVVIRNPHNPYAARPVFSKYPTKFKQQYPNHYQQLTNIQPIQFGQYQTAKPFDFEKPIESYAKPSDSRNQQSSGTEIFKQEVYKLPDSDAAPQSVSQQVKTAQQSLVTPKVPVSPYPHYVYQDSVLPSSILGSFGSFGVQSVKGRDPLFPTKTTYLPPQPTKQTIYNSFNFSPSFKTTPSQFVATTPKFQTTANQIHFGSNWNDYKNVPTQATKIVNPPKLDPNLNKGTFKPSPQDPFKKQTFGDYKVSTYNPVAQTTTFAYSNYHDYNYPSQQNQQNAQVQNYFDQQNVNFNYENKQSQMHDNLAAGVNQQASQQYASPPKKTEVEVTPHVVPFRATYEVTETYETDDIITHSSPPPWPATPESYYNQKSTEGAITKQEYDVAYSKPIATPVPELPEEFAIVTEGEKGYENSLSYDSQVESQSRRPLGDDFEPIGKHILKDYYYKVSTPAYDNNHSARRTKKPMESPKLVNQQEATTQFDSDKERNNELLVEALPTLPPNQHFKRPSASTPEPVDKDRIRKRNKIRRRRPLANINRDKELSTRKYIQSSTEAPQDAEEVHTIRPRVRQTQSKPQTVATTPSITTDLTTSALPTVSPTIPTIVKKKLVHRRPYTTSSEKYETTALNYKVNESSKDSPIMKISASSRPQLPKASSPSYEYRTSETPDYSHKQDEKDTPTSDIAVSLTDTLKTTSNTEPAKEFSFHRDVKPVEGKMETVTIREVTTETFKDSSEIINDVTTVTPRVEPTNSAKILRPRLKNKYDRPRFSVKDYRNRLSSTTSTTEKSAENQTPKHRFPQRRIPASEYKFNENENGTERKKIVPKDAKHKQNESEVNEQTEKEVHLTRQSYRQRQTTAETTEGTTQKISSRIRHGSRRPKPTEETTETSSPTTVHSKRPLRKKVKDSEIGESVQDISVTDATVNYDHKNDITSERTRSESAIMKIADKKHQDHIEHLFEHSKRVSDLTLAASKDYNTPGMFKTVATNSRRIPNYFTIATDDPILPIEAFFPQLNQKRES